MSAHYLMSRKWSMTERLTITDDTGAPQFEIRGRFGLTSKLVISDSTGAEVAGLSKRAFSSVFEIQAGGTGITTVRPRGFFGARYEIESSAGPMEARGNFSGRNYAVARGGVTVATVAQQRSLRERFAIEVADGENPVLMLAVILAIETIRDQRRDSASAAGAAGAGA